LHAFFSLQKIDVTHPEGPFLPDATQRFVVCFDEDEKKTKETYGDPCIAFQEI